MIIGHGASWERINVVSKDRLAPLNWVIVRLNMDGPFSPISGFLFLFLLSHTYVPNTCVVQ